MSERVEPARATAARRVCLWVGIGLAVPLVLVTLILRDLRVNTILLCLVLAMMLGLHVYLDRRGLLPEALAGTLGSVALAAWLAGHLAETADALRRVDPKPVAVSDVAFAISLTLMVVVFSRVWLRSGSYVDRSGMLRTGVDTLLIALGVALVIWQVTIGWLWTPAPGAWAGVLTAYVYIVCGAALAASLLTRAWQRGDPGSRELAAVVTVVMVGVMVWSLAKFGPDFRYLGVMLMTLGLLGLPAAIAHPSHQRTPRWIEGYRHDHMGALAFHFGCWGLGFLSLYNQQIGAVIVGLGLVSVTVVYLRVYLVRSSEQRLVDRLRVLAYTDPLTSVGNRRSLLERLNRSGPTWLITIDLDGFKQVNDQYGHEAGDEVLRSFVARMQRIIPAGAHLARIGGDEFAVIVDGNAATATALSQRVVEEARDPHYARLTASVGLTRHRAGAHANRTVRDSDIAMQEAKRAGKDRLAVLTAQMVESRLRDLEVGARLAETMSTVRVAYQPIVALSAGNPVIAVEALARWHHPDLGEVAPGEFIPIAEQQGLVADLGLEVFGQVLRQTSAWLDAGAPRQVTFNVSWLQLRDPDSVGALARQIRSNPRVAEWIVLEVTETVFSEDEGAVAAIRMLRDLGVVIAVDDFGTGVSNLRRLRTLPVDVLKIDKSLLDGVADDLAAEAMLEMVSGLGRALGMAVIAEGVEDEGTVRVLGEIGLTAAQGYVFARPCEPADVPAPIPLLRPWLGRPAHVGHRTRAVGRLGLSDPIPSPNGARRGSPSGPFAG